MIYQPFKINTNKKLERYQDDGIGLVARKLITHNSCLAVSPTGSGKCVILSAMSYRFIAQNIKEEKGDVIIFVHKQELLDDTRSTLLDWYGIISQKIDKDTKTIQPNTRVFVAMVETFNNRSKQNSFLDHMKNVGLVIIDEAHLNSFTKIISHFPLAKRVGFTATPLSATKKDPLKNRWQSIVIIAKTSQLIELNQINPERGVVSCDAYSLALPGVRKRVKMKGEEFDDKEMGKEFSRKKQIQNTLKSYKKYAIGKKTIIFNSNIEHSLDVCKAFQDCGFNVRHIDGNCSDAYRRETLGSKEKPGWISTTPNAILCNVGVATTGFDEKSIECVIVNKITASLPLFIQMCGRGSRAYIYPDGSIKTDYLLLDMGDNMSENGGGFGNPSENIDWEYIFNNPKIPKPGIAPIKLCPSCGSMNTASARICGGKKIDWLSDEVHDCGYIFPVVKQIEDMVPKELVRIINEKINVKQTIEFFKDGSEWSSFYNIINGIANLARKELAGVDYLDSDQLLYFCETAYIKTSQWFKEVGKRKYPNFRYDIKDKIVKALQKVGFIVTIEEFEELIKDDVNENE